MPDLMGPLEGSLVMGCRVKICSLTKRFLILSKLATFWYGGRRSRAGIGTLDVTGGRCKAKRFSNRPAVAAGALNRMVVGARFDCRGSDNGWTGLGVVVVVIAVEKVFLGAVVGTDGRKAGPVLVEN